MIANYMTNYSENERIILLNKLDQLTTVYYPDEQIASYHTSLSTTPMTDIIHISNISKSSAHSNGGEVQRNIWHPTNHRSRYSNVQRTAADRTIPLNTNQPQKRMFLTDSNDDDYDNEYYDYVESTQHANSIQDILEQGNNNGRMHPSLSYSRTAKIAGYYWHQKPSKIDVVQPMESNTSGQMTELMPPLRNANITDPFSKFKPSSPDDVNLLASANPLKLISQYKQHKPKPLTSAPNPFNKQHTSEYDGSDEANAHMRYKQHRINTVRLDKQMRKQQKPFSLMLDVYPMADDDDDAIQTMSAARPLRSFTHPVYPIHVNAMTHNTQYGKQNYNHMKYAQLQQYRLPFTKAHGQNDALYRTFGLNRINPTWYRINPRSTPPQQLQGATMASEHVPSQITLHLNLYPTPDHSNSKQHQRSNIDEIDVDDNMASTVEITGKRSVQLPPFSPFKINSLQHTLNASDMVSSEQLNSGEYGRRTKSKGFAVGADINHRLSSITSTASSYLGRANLRTLMATSSLGTVSPVT